MLVLNFILFQVAWFTCVIGAAKGMPWLGVAVTVLVVFWHFYQAMLSSGLIHYLHHGWNNSLVPVWILALWLAFACTLNVSLRWMRGRHLIAILFGALGGPLAYMGAEKLGAVVLLGVYSYIALSISWAIITPSLIKLSTQFDGFSALKTMP